MILKDVNENEVFAVDGGNQQTCFWGGWPWITFPEPGELCIGIRW